MHWSNKTRKKLTLIVLAVAAMGTFTWAAYPASRSGAASHGTPNVVAQSRAMTYLLKQTYTTAELATGSYVGSEFCLSCHVTLHPESAEWYETKHSYFIRKPMGTYSLKPGKGVMANALGGPKDDFIKGLDFNTQTGTAFDTLKPNAPILSYDGTNDIYQIQLGPSGLKLKVAATLAGQSVGNGQRYMVRIPTGDSDGWSKAIYFGPVVWGGTAWTSNASNWYTGNTPKYPVGVLTTALGPLQTQNYLKTCSGCHITGIRKVGVTTAGEYIVNPFPAVLFNDTDPNYPDLDGDGQADMANIGCESCHGPGSNHIMMAGDPTKIVNPEKITNNQQRSDICLQCHAQIASVPNSTWGFSYNETAHKPFVVSNPMDSLTKYQVFTGGKWPDGKNYAYARIDSYKESGHYLGAYGIACNDCHNPHAEQHNPAQVRDKITRGTPADIPSSVENNSFCLACHAGYGPFAKLTKAQIKDWNNNRAQIGAVTVAHTHHGDTAERIMGVSRCITCHMAPTAGRGAIAGAAHNFMPARPEDTIALADAKGTGSTQGATGNVNSCSSGCHRGRVQVWTDVPLNPTPTDNKFNTTNEINLAKKMVKYYGPGGTWWNTKPAAAHEIKNQ